MKHKIRIISFWRRWPYCLESVGGDYVVAGMRRRITKFLREGTAGLGRTDEAEEITVESSDQNGESSEIHQEETSRGYVTEDREYRGFVIDNVFHSVSEGDIHYNVYILTAMTAANHMRFILPCRDMRGCIFREFPPISSRKNLDLKLRDIMKK